MFTDPDKNIEQFGLKPGDQVADLGAGSGFYTLAAAAKIGENGKVFAIEVQKDMLSRLRDLAVSKGFSNVEVVWGDIEEARGTRLRDGSINAAILANTLFQLDHREGLLVEIKRILAPEGRLLVVDWADSYKGMGPQPDHLISEETARKLFEREGFIIEKTLDAGAHHYGFVAKRR